MPLRVFEAQNGATTPYTAAKLALNVIGKDLTPEVHGPEAMTAYVQENVGILNHNLMDT